MTPAASDKRIALAAVAGAHGVKGEVRLKLFSESVESLSRHEKLFVGGVERRLLSISDGGKTAVARFEGAGHRVPAPSAYACARQEALSVSRASLRARS